jgi:hypothetical protein
MSDWDTFYFGFVLLAVGLSAVLSIVFLVLLLVRLLVARPPSPPRSDARQTTVEQVKPKTPVVIF